MARRAKDDKTLTRVEMEIMNILWDKGGIDGMNTHAIIAQYPEPQPAYSTIATFMKILTEKGFVSVKKLDSSSKTFNFCPLITREEYTRRFMNDVKNSFFAGSLRSLITFFAKEEEIGEEELKTILSIIEKKS